MKKMKRTRTRMRIWWTKMAIFADFRTAAEMGRQPQLLSIAKAFHSVDQSFWLLISQGISALS